MVTVHWEKQGIADERAAWATGRFIKLMSDYIGSKGGRIAYAWVRENGDGKGSHVHILIHLPRGRGIGQKARGWIGRITRKPYQTGAIDTRRIAGTADACWTAPALHRTNLATALSYVLKGASAEARAALPIWHAEIGGRIIGKRCSTSQNIAEGARARARASIREGVAVPFLGVLNLLTGHQLRKAGASAG
jgi:hypothetical protein